MKNRSIAVAGKGGTGKSTIAALLISRLIARGETPVLAIDADPDSNLGNLLGIEPKQTIGDLREEVLKEIKNFPAGMDKTGYVRAGLHQIIEEAHGFDLITMGRGEGSGCYCSLNNMIRKFSDDLSPSYPRIVIDNEAGLEHLSRRTTQNIDALLIIVSDNPLSLSSAKSITEITDDLESRIRKRFIITNMIHEDRKQKIYDRLSSLNIEILCNLPFDEELEETIYNGEPVNTLTDTPIITYIDQILDRIGGNNGNT
jgi:CO dehydrogenase maturation factor